MKLCVLMPVYNESRFIESAIASILPVGEHVDLQIIIVDDGSTDDTVSIIKNIIKTAPFITLIRTPNHGVTRARNTLLEAIPKACDLVTFLDGDDSFAPGYLAKMCRILAQDPTLDLTYAQLCLISSDSQDMGLEPTDNSQISRSISMSIGVYRTAFLAKIGKFDTTFDQAEDTDYLLRLFESGPNVDLRNDIAVLYRQHANNMTKNQQQTKAFFARAIMGHIRRRRADPALASVAGVFSITQLGADLTKRRQT